MTTSLSKKVLDELILKTKNIKYEVDRFYFSSSFVVEYEYSSIYSDGYIRQDYWTRRWRIQTLGIYCEDQHIRIKPSLYHNIETNKIIEKLSDKIIELMYQPGNLGAKLAKEHFKSLENDLKK